VEVNDILALNDLNTFLLGLYVFTSGLLSLPTLIALLDIISTDLLSLDLSKLIYALF